MLNENMHTHDSNSALGILAIGLGCPSAPWELPGALAFGRLVGSTSKGAFHLLIYREGQSTFQHTVLFDKSLVREEIRVVGRRDISAISRGSSLIPQARGVRRKEAPVLWRRGACMHLPCAFLILYPGATGGHQGRLPLHAWVEYEKAPTAAAATDTVARFCPATFAGEITMETLRRGARSLSYSRPGAAQRPVPLVRFVGRM